MVPLGVRLHHSTVCFCLCMAFSPWVPASLLVRTPAILDRGKEPALLQQDLILTNSICNNPIPKQGQILGSGKGMNECGENVFQSSTWGEMHEQRPGRRGRKPGQRKWPEGPQWLGWLSRSGAGKIRMEAQQGGTPRPLKQPSACPEQETVFIRSVN